MRFGKDPQSCHGEKNKKTRRRRVKWHVQAGELILQEGEQKPRCSSSQSGATQMEAVAAVVGAVDVLLCWTATVKTFADDRLLHSVDRYGQAFIKDETLTFETLPPYLRVLSIGDDSTFQLRDVAKPLLQHEGGQLLTADSPRVQ